jgi:hypothetical protein
MRIVCTNCHESHILDESKFKITKEIAEYGLDFYSEVISTECECGDKLLISVDFSTNLSHKIGWTDIGEENCIVVEEPDFQKLADKNK